MRIQTILIVFLLTITLSACVQQDPLTDLRVFVQQQDAKPKGTIEPPPEFIAPDFASYTASGRRSPFEIPRPVELVKEEQQVPKSNVKPDQTRVKEYLETFRIENIGMVGTLSGFDDPNTLWGLVRDGQGEVHRVKVGNYLGRNFGKIIDITETQIDLIEIVPSGSDNWVERPRIIILDGLEQ